MMIGASKPTRSQYAWTEVYRSLAHGTARSACEDKTVIAKFPAEIADFAIFFVDMQTKRHAADYNPTGTFYKSAVKADIERAEKVIRDFSSTQTKHKRAFASWLLFKNMTKNK